MTEKTYNVTHRRKLADGTVKIYIESRKYTVRDHGEIARRSKLDLTDEQITDIKRRLSDGVTKAKIMNEYKCSWTALTNLLNENPDL